jgi:hypothetical protein
MGLMVELFPPDENWLGRFYGSLFDIEIHVEARGEGPRGLGGEDHQGPSTKARSEAHAEARHCPRVSTRHPSVRGGCYTDTRGGIRG